MSGRREEFYICIHVFVGICVTTVYLGWVQGLSDFKITLLFASAATSALLTLASLRTLQGVMTRSIFAGFGSISGILLASLSLGISALLVAVFALVGGVVWWMTYLDTISKLTKVAGMEALPLDVKLKKLDWQFQFYLALSRDAIWVTVMVTMVHVTGIVVLAQTGHTSIIVGLMITMIWTWVGIMLGVHARSQKMMMNLIHERADY